MLHQTMPKPKSVEPVSMLLLPSPALLLAEGIAEAEAKAPRLRAKQGRVATRKKGRLGPLLCDVWAICFDLCRPFRGPHNRGSVHRTEQPGRPERKGQPRDSVRQLPPEEKKG